MSTDRLFPIMAQDRKAATPAPSSVPWEIAERAYSVYSARYGTSQSLKRLAERGGFHPGEMDDLLPGWRDEVNVFAQLRAELKAALRDAESWRTEAERTERKRLAAQVVTDAARDVLAERQRQVEKEGHSHARDDAYTKEGPHRQTPLAQAAAMYLTSFAIDAWSGQKDVWHITGCPEGWDYAKCKPGLDRRRNLVKAAALILAEIERLDRAALGQVKP